MGQEKYKKTNLQVTVQMKNSLSQNKMWGGKLTSKQKKPNFPVKKLGGSGGTWKNFREKSEEAR